MSDARRRSPLHGRREIVVGDTATLREHAFLGKLVLRGDPGALGDGLQDAMGSRGPEESCRSTSAEGRSVLWIGPDERWLVVPAETELDVAKALSDRLGETPHHAVDVTDYYVAIGLSGARARDMLVKLTPLDIHPAVFPVGAVAGTVFGRGQATLWRPAEGSGVLSDYVLFVRASFADYLWCLLAEAGREYGVPPETPIGGETWRLER